MHINTNANRKGMTILISDKGDFREEKITSAKRWPYVPKMHRVINASI